MSTTTAQLIDSRQGHLDRDVARVRHDLAAAYDDGTPSPIRLTLPQRLRAAARALQTTHVPQDVIRSGRRSSRFV